MRKLLCILALVPLVGFSQSSDIEIPNVFTPNGDQVNDVFFINTSYANVVCTIFNRYGEVVYRYEGRKGTWDGRTHAGVEVPEGVYFVLVEASDSEGNSELAQGSLTLIR